VIPPAHALAWKARAWAWFLMGIPGFQWARSSTSLRGNEDSCAGQEQARWDPGSLRHCPAPFAAAGKTRRFTGSLRETDSYRPHAPVPPVAPNGLAPDRLRWRFPLPIALAKTRHFARYPLKTR
jgi:hypothetical protein